MHKENDIEKDTGQALPRSGGYEKGDPDVYAPEAALITLAFTRQEAAHA